MKRHTVRDVMTTPAITVPPEATIAEAARLLDRHRIKWLPVVDDKDRLTYADDDTLRAARRVRRA